MTDKDALKSGQGFVDGADVDMTDIDLINFRREIQWEQVQPGRELQTQSPCTRTNSVTCRVHDRITCCGRKKCGDCDDAKLSDINAPGAERRKDFE